MFDIRELNVAMELWGVSFCLVGIACTLLLSRPRSRHRRIVLALFSLELIYAGADAVAGLYRGLPGDIAWFMTHASNLTEYISGYLLAATFTVYVCRRLEGCGASPLKAWETTVWVLCIGLCVATVCGMFYYIDEQNLYHRSTWYWVSAIVPAAIYFLNTILIIHERGRLPWRTLACLLIYAFVPFVALIIQSALYGLNLIVMASALALVLILLEMQADTSSTLLRQTEELANARLELAESRMRTMVSQIQPHFVFNALDTIYGLIHENPELAGRTLVSFSDYLRTNLESINRTAPVPIDTELEHVRTYLELERMADEEKIAYTIDSQVKGFLVPALSVQVIAENAVKHGIAASEQGGHVWVSTREWPDEYTVSVVDDGVGFDVDAVLSADGHVGIANTRGRLQAMCGGTLEVTSTPGKGTTSTIHLPKDRETRQ